MIKLVQTIEPKGVFVYPNTPGKHQKFAGISILAPLPNSTTIQFEGDPFTYPVEVIQGLTCQFTGFTIKNDDSVNPITLTMYLQTNPQEFLPRSNEIQNQVSVNAEVTTNLSSESYKVVTGSSSSTTPVSLDLGAIYDEVDIIITGGNAMVSFQLKDKTYGQYFELPAGYFAYNLKSYGINFYAATSLTTNLSIIGLK